MPQGGGRGHTVILCPHCESDTLPLTTRGGVDVDRKRAVNLSIVGSLDGPAPRDHQLRPSG
jgi:hypothetical protein